MLLIFGKPRIKQRRWLTVRRYIGGVGPHFVSRQPPVAEHAFARSLLIGGHNPAVREGPLVSAPSPIPGFGRAEVAAGTADPWQVG